MLDQNEYIGDKEFQRILDKHKIDFPVYQIKTYVMGLLLSVEFIAPSHALDEILLTNTEDEVVFHDKNAAEKFYHAFGGLWNHLAGYINTDDSPKLIAVPNKFKTDKAKTDFLMKKSDELVNFMIGLDESGASEYFQSDAFLYLSSQSLESICEILTEFYSRIDMGKKVLSEELDDLLLLAKDLNESIWPHSFPVINNQLYRIRTGQVELKEPEEVFKEAEAILQEQI